MAKAARTTKISDKTLGEAADSARQFAAEERDSIEKEDMQIEDLYARVYAEKRLHQLARYLESLKTSAP